MENRPWWYGKKVPPQDLVHKTFYKINHRNIPKIDKPTGPVSELVFLDLEPGNPEILQIRQLGIIRATIDLNTGQIYKYTGYQIDVNEADYGEDHNNPIYVYYSDKGQDPGINVTSTTNLEKLLRNSYLRDITTIICHNVKHDKPYISSYLGNEYTDDVNWICSLHNYYDFWQGSAALERIAAHNDIIHTDHHNALEDAAVLATILTLPRQYPGYPNTTQLKLLLEAYGPYSDHTLAIFPTGAWDTRMFTLLRYSTEWQHAYLDGITTKTQHAFYRTGTKQLLESVAEAAAKTMKMRKWDIVCAPTKDHELYSRLAKPPGKDYPANVARRIYGLRKNRDGRLSNKKSYERRMERWAF